MKNIIIIGGSSGIGEAITNELAKSNNAIYASYNKNIKESNDKIYYFYLDVLANQQEINFLPDQIDGLVYCPGSILLKPFARISADEFLQDYQLQVIGAVKIIQQLLPKLKKSPAASIVLFSTVAVQTGFNFHSIVAASKGAIEGLTKALAAELAPKIRVNCIAPSITNTPLAATLLNTEEKITANAQRHPLKKIGTAEDLASMACFLLSDQAAWITGQIMHVDGGMSSIKL
ncbi:MAG: SDR family oxidoreductase [Bacteroidetes bacterium]|nr:SDR family oxidoreductase [Bacteroidota bacterium]